MRKLHMNNLLVACGINVDPYKLDLKTAHHTPIVYKSLATLKNHVSVVHRPPHRMPPCTCPRKSSWAPTMSVLIRLPAWVLPPHHGPVSVQDNPGPGKALKMSGSPAREASPPSLLPL